MSQTLIMIFFTAGIGLSVALIVWLVSKALSEVPDDDRQYKDKPPLGFRLLWWPVLWASYFFGAFIPAKTQESVSVKLRQAGLEYTITPVQFFGARVVSAVVMALLVFWLLGSFESTRPGSEAFSHSTYIQACIAGALFGWLYPAIWLRDRMQTRRKALVRALPFFLDIITLCFEAGLNFQGAVMQAVDKGPNGPLKEEFQRVMRDIRAGRSRADVLRVMASRVKEPGVNSFVSAVIQAESMGMNMGPVLRAQADQRRSERFLNAEKMAMEAPVKMLFPLIAFIFPCTFIVIIFLIYMKFVTSGVL